VSTPDSGTGPDPNDLRGLAHGLRHVVDLAEQTLGDEAGPSPVGRRVMAHLGCELSDVIPVTERFRLWEHVNVQRGVDAYLAEHGSGEKWMGLSAGYHPPHENMLSRINSSSSFGTSRVNAATYGTAPVGPDENTEVVVLGLMLAAAPDGAPVVIGIRAEQDYSPVYCGLELLAADRTAAIATRDEIERLIRDRNVFRGQVLSFSESEHYGNDLVSFLPRPTVTADDVVLPDGLLQTIERHVIGVADWSRELLSAGQHLKRGLLLHGPPGTGKTHTVRYLTGRLTDSTVILLTGTSIRFIDRAAALARRLQPTMVVLEDVDLVGMDRDFTPDSNPLLFSLLEAMDGIGADADVTFVLTTNRADILELALADRPGRVDLAVEIPRPDAQCRKRLLRLYARDLVIDADLGEAVAGTEGVTASFIKEMIRRTVLVSLRAGDRPPALRGAYFAEVLAEMNAEHHALTRSLLGVDAGDADSPEPDGADTALGPLNPSGRVPQRARPVHPRG
jgi:ATPase family associated with various cellular activities (AAA)